MKMLNKDPSQRISAQEALNHVWFKNMFSENNKELLNHQKINFKETYLKDIISKII